MITDTIAGTSVLVRSEQTQQALSTAMMKQAAARQNQVADLLAQTARQTPQPATAGDSNFNFSTYA